MDSTTGALNIVVFMTDQQYAGTTLAGHPRKAITPRLDAFRREAVTFTNAYAVSPHCCPSRASFFTGAFPSEHGVWNNVGVANALSRGPAEGMPFWSDALSGVGYRLGFAGKWHVSNTKRPADYGWDECLVTWEGLGREASLTEQRNEARKSDVKRLATQEPPRTKRREGEIIRSGYPTYTHYGESDNPFCDADVVASGIDFINKSVTGAPWCLFVGTLGPHDPYIPPKHALDQYDLDAIELPTSFHDEMRDKPALYRRTRARFDQLTEREHRETLRHYLAFCTYEDELFGLLLDAVEASGQSDNTIFVYLSDHGDYAGSHGLWCKGLPAFDEAVNIPLIIGGGGVWKSTRGVLSPDSEMRGKSVDTLVSIADIGSTILDLCEVEGPPMSGQSFVNVLLDVPNQPRTELVIQSNGNEIYGHQRVVRTDSWKLVVNFFDDDELYDLREDPDELHNLLWRPSTSRRVGVGPLESVPHTLATVVEDLYARLWRFSMAHGDDLTHDYIMTALATHGPGVIDLHALGAEGGKGETLMGGTRVRPTAIPT